MCDLFVLGWLLYLNLTLPWFSSDAATLSAPSTPKVKIEKELEAKKTTAKSVPL
jgi:hypothetical protein